MKRILHTKFKPKVRSRSKKTSVIALAFLAVMLIGFMAGIRVIELGTRTEPRAQTVLPPTCSFTYSPTQVCPGASVTYRATCSNCTSMSIAKSGNNTNTWTDITQTSTCAFTSSSGSCSGNTTFADSGGGGYAVVCNAYHTNGLKCTGNPYCTSYPCGSGYSDCGSNDYVGVFSLSNNCPTPTPQPTVPRPTVSPTRTPTPLPSCGSACSVNSNCSGSPQNTCTICVNNLCTAPTPTKTRTPTPGGNTPTRTRTPTKTPTPAQCPAGYICASTITCAQGYHPYSNGTACGGLLNTCLTCLPDSTPTRTRTPTKTRTPTPGGTVNSPTPTPFHRACVNGTCRKVAGSGQNECSTVGTNCNVFSPTPGGGNCPNGNLGNINCDSGGLINENDLSILLTKWHTGGCPAPAPGPGQHSSDLNGDCKVDESDLSKLLINWKTV